MSRAISSSKERARDAVRFHFNVSARRFVLRRHQRNVIRPLARAMVDRFGPGVITPEIELATGITADLAKRGSE